MCRLWLPCATACHRTEFATATTAKPGPLPPHQAPECFAQYDQKTASHLRHYRSSVEPEIFQAIVQLAQPLGVIGDGLTGLDERASCLVAIAQDHVGPDQPQPSLYIVAILFQSTVKTFDHAAH